MLRAYKFRLRPTTEQKALLAKQAGSCRWLWNHFLELNQDEYKKTGKFIFAHQLIVSLPKLKKEYGWLGGTFSQSLQQVARHFDRALKDFLNPELKREFPVFKKKAKMRDGFTIPQKFRIEKNYVFIPKAGEIEWIKHRAIKGKIKHLTVKQDGNQWYCSVCVELKVKKPVIKVNSNIVGIDMGLKTYATMSDGSKVENPKTLVKYQKKLNLANRRLQKRKKGSKNRDKQRLEVARIHRKIRNIRRDFQHKTTAAMIAKYDGFVLEDLNIQGMLKNHCLAKAISDAGWYEYKRQLIYKAEWAGKPVIEIGRFEPSSKTCSCCGWYDEDLTLADREFVCQECGIVQDRDLNAATNIRNIGMKTVGQDCARTGELVSRTAEDDKRFMPQGRCLSKSQQKECSGLNELVLLN